MICTKCGTELIEGAAFCHKCGRAADWQPSKKKRGNRQGTAIKRGKVWMGISPGYSYMTTDKDGNVTKHRIRPAKSGFRTKSAALAWAATANPRLRPAPTFEELWQGYSADVLPKLSVSRQGLMHVAYKHISALMPRRVDEVTIDDIMQVLEKTCPTAPTRTCAKSLLSALYKRAMASNGPTGHITQNLSKYITLPEHRVREANIFNRDEISKIWEAYAAGDDYCGYILMMLYTGLMPAEVIGLNVKMIDPARREIRDAGLKTEYRKEAVVVYPNFLDGVVSAIIAGASPDGSLCPMSRHQFLRQYYRSLERAGIDNPKDDKGVHRLTPYSCRHTFGTEIVRLGLYPAVVAKMMRHTNTTTQQRYTHLAESDVRAAISQLQK